MKHEKSDVGADKKLIRKAMKMHDKQAHPGKHTSLKGLKKGGPTTDDRMRLGRGLSRVANQKSEK